MITTLQQVKDFLKMASQLEFPVKVNETEAGFIELSNEYGYELIELPILESDLIYKLSCTRC